MDGLRKPNVRLLGRAGRMAAAGEKRTEVSLRSHAEDQYRTAGGTPRRRKSSTRGRSTRGPRGMETRERPARPGRIALESNEGRMPQFSRSATDAWCNRRSPFIEARLH